MGDVPLYRPSQVWDGRYLSEQAVDFAESFLDVLFFRRFLPVGKAQSDAGTGVPRS